jgi:hypothetical protein
MMGYLQALPSGCFHLMFPVRWRRVQNNCDHEDVEQLFQQAAAGLHGLTDK